MDAHVQTDPEQKVKIKKRGVSVKAISNMVNPMSAFKTQKTSQQLEIEKAKEKKAVFADKEAMQAQVRLALIKPQYNVNDYYWEHGCIQKIAKHYLFEHITF